MARVGSSKMFALLGTGGRTYSITPSTSSINEGSAVTFTVSTFSVPDASVLYWTTTGTVTDADFTDGVTSGTVTITSGVGTIIRTSVEDSSNEGIDNFALQLRTESTSGEVVAVSSSVDIVNRLYTITPVASSVDEGNGLTFNVATTNVPNTTLYWTINNITSSDADFGAMSGSFTITSSAGSFQVTTIADETTEGAQTFTVSIRVNSISGAIVQTSDTMTIIDSSVTPATGQLEMAAVVLNYPWVCPPLVFSVSVVCVGGGGGSGGYTGGGGGGGLAYGNNITVVPGNTYLLQVGYAGSASIGTSGLATYFISSATLQGGGGTGAGYLGTGTAFVRGGGGGAGGYSGAGGAGAIVTPSNATRTTPSGGSSSGTARSGGFAGGAGGKETTNASFTTNTARNGTAGTGGSGGGGGGCKLVDNGAGGGVCLYGEGASGAGGLGSTTSPGAGGTGSAYILPNGSTAVTVGGGSRGYISNGQAGGIRLIWPGNHRSFPSTRTGFEGDPIFDLSTPPVEIAEVLSYTYTFKAYTYVGATYYWTVNNITTTSSDWSGGITPSGSFTVSSAADCAITLTAANNSSILGNRTFYIEIRDGSTSGTILADTSSSPTTLSDSGQDVYTTPGTYTWIAPADVTSVSVLAVGGGGGGGANYAGGSGGGLGYRNNITVVPGQSYTVVVGDYGRSPNQGSSNGGDSYFIDTATVKGGGGRWGSTFSPPPAGGSFTGDGGGTGGAGGIGGGGTSSGPGSNYWGAGGGAGGYSGAGGAGALSFGTGYAAATGSGGGGGGGAGINTAAYGGAGGGVGLYGRGSDGQGGATYDESGSGGSGGSPASRTSYGYGPYNYGGGGAGASTGSGIGRGGVGAVRIVWPGTLRQFPITGVTNF